MARKMKLDKDLVEILLTPSFNNFTVLELRSAYLANTKDPTLTKVEARRFVYRHILRLEKNGFLLKKKSQGKARVYYSKTESLKEATFEPSSTKEDSLPEEQHVNSRNEYFTELQTKLSRYKSDLLSALGEMDEYRSLSKLFPKHAKAMEECYREASEECSKIHGRINGIEKLLSKGYSESRLNAAS